MSLQLTRRQALAASLGGACIACECLGAPPPETVRRTFVYKTVGGLPIRADVLRPDDRQTRGVVVWIHGGALINGHREGVSDRVKQWAAASGLALVSIDYRLAPETKLPEIIGDVEDAFAWIRRDGPRLFQADSKRLVVTGGSAGGYLTLVTGHRVRPRPAALLALWGYGDLVGPWYSEPSPHPRHQRVKLSKEKAWEQVSGPPISDSRQRRGDGGAFYQHCRQHGSWPEAVSGWNPKTQAAKFAPFMPVANVDQDYPPTALVHGQRDTDVPHEQSELMAAEFRRHNVPHAFHSIPNGEHGLAGADKQRIDEAYRQAFVFLTERLSG